MKSFLCFAIGAVLILNCLALECPECQRELCKNQGPCRYGHTLDACSCCDTCFRGIGERCGGPWNSFGFCTRYLSCIRYPGMKDDEEFKGAGKCLALPK